MSARISFDTTSYKGTEKWRNAGVWTTAAGLAERYGEDRTAFIYRVAAWNRREAARDLRATLRWADKVAKANPSESFRATLQPGCAKALAQLELLGCVKDSKVTVAYPAPSGSPLR